jgi:hypothetical protein
MLVAGTRGGDVRARSGREGERHDHDRRRHLLPIPNGLVLAGDRLWTTLASKDRYVGVSSPMDPRRRSPWATGPRALAIVERRLSVAERFLALPHRGRGRRRDADESRFAVGAQAVVVDGDRAFVSNRVHDDVEIVEPRDRHRDRESTWASTRARWRSRIAYTSRWRTWARAT